MRAVMPWVDSKQDKLFSFVGILKHPQEFLISSLNSWKINAQENHFALSGWCYPSIWKILWFKKKKRNPNRQYILMVQSITRCSRVLQLKASNWETLLNLKLRFNWSALVSCHFYSSLKVCRAVLTGHMIELCYLVCVDVAVPACVCGCGPGVWGSFLNNLPLCTGNRTDLERHHS